MIPSIEKEMSALKNIVVIGGSGNVGREILAALIEKKDEFGTISALKREGVEVSDILKKLETVIIPKTLQVRSREAKRGRARLLPSRVPPSTQTPARQEPRPTSLLPDRLCHQCNSWIFPL